MTFIRITRHFTFEMAHYLHKYDGLCKNIHGHSYKLFVTVGGKVQLDIDSSQNGMVTDFGKLKKIVNEVVVDKFDHALVVNNAVPDYAIDDLSKITERLIVIPFQPTCENLVSLFAATIRLNLPEDIRLISLKLYETASSYAEWYYEDNTDEL